jgi:hypothetical protein
MFPMVLAVTLIVLTVVTGAATLVIRRSAAPLRAEVDSAPVTFDDHADQALAVVAKDSDPVTMPPQHPADCKCSRCRTRGQHDAGTAAARGYHPARRPLASDHASDPRVQCNCGRHGCTGCMAFEAGERLIIARDLWADLATDQQIAFALDQLMDRPEPATLIERAAR